MRDRDLYLHKILPFLGKPLIKVVTGMRRTGKSTFLQLIQNYLRAQDGASYQFISINMESLEFEHLNRYDVFYRYIKAEIANSADKPILFIDEVQEIEHWEKAITSLYSENLCDIILTGSNAHLLSSELATLLSGRYVEIPMYPLTFREFLSFQSGSQDTHLGTQDLFNQFIKYGGFPGLHVLPQDESVLFTYLSSLFNTVLLKDVVGRYTIRDPHLLERIARFIFDNCGNITNPKRVSNYFKAQNVKCSVDTVMKYLTYLQDAFLIYRVPRFDIKGLRLLEVNDKYYLGDVGLRHSFLGYKDRDISGLLENIVYLELLARGWKVSVGKFDQYEIDFVAEKNGTLHYYQVAYVMPDQSTRDREFRSLELIPDNYEKTVLSLDPIQEDRKGIRSINLMDWLVS